MTTELHTTDADLVARSRDADNAAFGVLVERHQPMAERVAAGVVGDRDLGRELAQEAVLQAYLSLGRLRDGERFGSWLYGIVLNVCRGYLRDRRSDPFSLEALAGGLRFDALPFGSLEPDPQEIVEANELHKLVLASVESLSPRNRVATLMYYYDQLSVREIAATLGISTSAVKVRLHRSRQELRGMLLPELDDIATQDEKEEDMVEVTITDIKEARHPSGETPRPQYVAVLFDQEDNRVLPIWIGPNEAAAIAAGLKQVEVPRPLTHHFTASLLKAAEVDVEHVRVEELKDDTFYAIVALRAGEAPREVDARPSDAMALAVQAGCPIYVSEDVFEAAGFEIPTEVGDRVREAPGIEHLAAEVLGHSTSHSHAEEEAEPTMPEDPEAKREEMKQSLIELFSDGEPTDDA